MLQTLKKIALILDDKQSFSNLENIENNQTDDVQDNVQVYLALANFVIRDIAANYDCFTSSQKLISNSEGKILLSALNYQPHKIRKVKNFFGKSVKFDVQIDSIIVPTCCEQYSIEYTFYPDDATLSDTLVLPLGVDSRTICYGVITEYYIMKMQFNEAAVWELKYKESLKNMFKRFLERKFLKRGL